MKPRDVYKIRNNISEENEVHCLAFTAPLMDFGDTNESDGEDYSDFKQIRSIVRAKKKWKKLAEIVLDQRTQIPLKQMALKAKHQDILFNKM